MIEIVCKVLCCWCGSNVELMRVTDTQDQEHAMSFNLCNNCIEEENEAREKEADE